ncbi:mucin TcMUCII [Trypanosoma cruzi]|nr:mucin TcMUCII [Trypanosoma cruzi]
MKWRALNMNDGRRQLNYFCDEYWLHFPWTNNPRGLRESPFFTVTLLLCCCVRCPLLMWCALCVCLLHLSSPLLLSISLTVQISSTPLNDHTHDDDDVPSAVRPVAARPVLLTVCVRDCT